MKSFKSSLWQNLHGLLVAKSTCVTSGWMLNTAITISVALMMSKVGVQQQASTSTSAASDAGGGALVNISVVEAITTFLITFIIFCLILVATALLGRAVEGAQWIPERLRSTYSSGLAFIPAWQWKNVVSALMVACLGGAAADRSPYLVAAVVLAIAALTAVVQITLEQWASNSDETSLAFQIFNGLRTALGLGIGFAVNVLAYALLGAKMKEASVMAIYVICLTVGIAVLQYTCKPLIESKKEIWSPLLLRTLGFLLIASNFVVGWAWKAGIDMIVAANLQQGLMWQLLAALLITCALSCIIVAISLGSVVPSLKGMPGLEDLCMLACAMNVGWAWAGFAMACIGHYEKESNAGKALNIGEMWLFTLSVVCVASLMAVIIDMALRQIQPSDPEDQPLLK